MKILTEAEIQEINREITELHVKIDRRAEAGFELFFGFDKAPTFSRNAVLKLFSGRFLGDIGIPLVWSIGQ